MKFMFKKKLSRISAMAVALTVLVAAHATAFACSGLELVSQEGDAYWFRTCDMNDAMNVFGENGSVISTSYLVSYPAGVPIEFQSGTITPEHTVIGMSFSDSLYLLDGVNDTGLVGGLLMLNEGTSYSGDEAPEGYDLMVGMEGITWFLSQCKDVDEVTALAEKTLLTDAGTMHFTFIDTTGKSVVLEAADPENPGKFTVYESIGVVTNSPPYPEQIDNLKDYIGSSPELRTQNITSIELNGQTIEGVPGSADRLMSAADTARDRFIRLAIWSYLCDQGNNISNDNMLALGSSVFSHVNVSIDNGKGTYRYTTITDGVAQGQSSQYTQYTVCYDLARKTLYIRPYDTLTWTSLSIDDVPTDARNTYSIVRGVGSATTSAVIDTTTIPSVTDVFSDVIADQWYTDAVQYVYENGIMSGIGDSLFAPAKVLTRAEIAQILYNAEGTPEISGESKFSDVTDDDWYYSAVVWANENDIVAGYDDGTFGAEDTLTREQIATVLYNYAKYQQEDVSAAADLSDYNDADQVSDWAQAPVKWAVANKIISGTDTGLAPLGSCSRAEAAQMIANLK